MSRMDLKGGTLRKHLDPIAIRILKKRLVSGQITPQVFKDILKRQMIKYFFQNHENSLTGAWSGWTRAVKQRIGKTGTGLRNTEDSFNRHKRF